MTQPLRSTVLAVGCALWATVAGAQTTPTTTQSSQPSTSQSSDATRPATTTFDGDTGIWFVPTAEVLAHGAWSVSGYRRGTDYVQGYTNVGDFAGTFAVGVKDRVELFRSFLVDTRIDRDTTPLFSNNPVFGGVIPGYPLVTQPWTGDNLGDLYVGGKVNLWSEYRQNPLALAVRGLVKVPTGKESAGVSTGKADVKVDFVASKDVNHLVDLSGYAGYGYMGSPTGFTIPTSAFDWGAGAAFPSHSAVRGFAELTGNVPSGNTLTITGAPLVASDGSVAPLTSNVEKLTRTTVGVTFQMPKGFFAGIGLSWNVPRQSRNLASATYSPTAEDWDWQIRIGYHPGVPRHAPPPPPPPLPPPPPTAQNRPPTVKAMCDPCTVQVGQASTVTADARDPGGNPLTYRWTAPTGQFANPAVPQTRWTAPQRVGPVPVTITVNNGKGGMASDSVTIEVIRPPVKTYTFEDVHFDFDRYSLRPEATRILDEAIAAMREDPMLRLTIEGHTCNIGTAEYNLALGDRRANAVRDYLISRGVTANRLQTISYGEERPKYKTTRGKRRAA